MWKKTKDLTKLLLKFSRRLPADGKILFSAFALPGGTLRPTGAAFWALRRSWFPSGLLCPPPTNAEATNTFTQVHSPLAQFPQRKHVSELLAQAPHVHLHVSRL